MQEVYRNTGNNKCYAYGRAIASLKKYGKQITNADELKGIEGIGKETIYKVK